MTIPNESSPAPGWVETAPGMLERTRRASVITSVILAIPFATYFGLGPSAAWLSGVAWSLVNLYFISLLVRGVLSEDRNISRIILTMVVKFPALYLVGLILLRSEFLPVLWIVAGFTWPFAVIVLKGAGRAYMKLDEAEAK